MSFLTGSAPKASFNTSPTITPGQDLALNHLVALLQNQYPDVSASAYGGKFSAGLQPLQQKSLAGLEAEAMPQPPAVASKQASATGAAFNTLTDSLGYKAPHIDSTAAFTKGVVEPLTDNFLSRTMPAIAGKYGGSAGGAYSSGEREARGQAGVDLERILAQQGASFAYDASKANQSADLAGESARLSALTATPGTVSIPAITKGLDIQNLLSTLQGGAVPYNVAQTQTAGEYQDFLNTRGQGNALLAALTAAFSPQTIQTTGVGSGGSSGLLGGLLGGIGQFAGSPAGSSAIVSALSSLSDERAKEDLELVGEIEGLPFYRYKYKGDTSGQKYIGPMAQDVEKRLPHAVHTGADGFKRVNFVAVLEDMLEAA